jgi:hypothetical protein
MGFFSFKTAWRTLQGYEAMNMIRKGQMRGVAKGDVRSQVALITQLFGVVVSEGREGLLRSTVSPHISCNTTSRQALWQVC